MEPIGYTPSDSNQVRAIAFSSLGSVMCSAVKDSLKIWDLDPSVYMYVCMYVYYITCAVTTMFFSHESIFSYSQFTITRIDTCCFPFGR